MALTKRQKEVAFLITQGLSNQEIAKQLYVSVRSVERYILLILHKLELSSRTALVSYWLKGGIYLPDSRQVKVEIKLRQKQAREIRTTVFQQMQILTVLVISPGMSTREVARQLGLLNKDVQVQLFNLSDRQIVFDHRDSSFSQIQWFPTIAGIALYRAGRKFKDEAKTLVN